MKRGKETEKDKKKKNKLPRHDGLERKIESRGGLREEKPGC